MPQVTTLVFDGCYASSMTGPQDLFLVANAHWRHLGHSDKGLFRWETRSLNGQPIVTASGLKILPDGNLENVPETDVIWIPGIHYASEADFETIVAALEPCFPWLQEQSQKSTTICSHCTGSFVLAEAALLDSGPATTSWWMASRFQRRYPHIELHADQLIVEHDRVISGGAASCENLIALKMIERFMGHTVASLVAKSMLVDTNQVNQTPFLALHSHQVHKDLVVSEAQTWLQTNMTQAFSLERLAAEVNVSPRTLIRRFKKALGETPNTYSQNIRVEAAKHLLESSHLNTEAIMQRIGYEDISSFSRLFQRKTGLTPRAFRDRFQA